MSAALHQRFRASTQVHSRHFDAEVVVLDLAGGKYFSLDEVGAFVWERLTTGKTPGDVVNDVVAEFETDGATAGADVLRLLDELLAAGLVERDD